MRILAHSSMSITPILILYQGLQVERAASSYKVLAKIILFVVNIIISMLLPIGVSFQGAFMRASPISGVQEETSTRFINHVSLFGSCGHATVVVDCSGLLSRMHLCQVYMLMLLCKSFNDIHATICTEKLSTKAHMRFLLCQRRLTVIRIGDIVPATIVNILLAVLLHYLIFTFD